MSPLVRSCTYAYSFAATRMSRSRISRSAMGVLSGWVDPLPSQSPCRAVAPSGGRPRVARIGAPGCSILELSAIFRRSMTGLAIRCRGLVKRYPPDVLAVDGLDLAVSRGECVGRLGPNGAGKTTTPEILEGLTEPTSGEVEVLGRTWRGEASALRARLGITLQETHLYERL